MTEAFWLQPDWSGGNMRDGGEPFWMRPPGPAQRDTPVASWPKQAPMMYGANRISGNVLSFSGIDYVVDPASNKRDHLDNVERKKALKL